MDINQIEAYLAGNNLQEKLQAITALRNYEAEIALPILLNQMQAKDFLVRSFVARELGKKQTAESFSALLEMIKFDKDTNVRAEAANSLSLFGEISAPHLLLAFYKNDNWLVHRSILAALMELNCPQELFEVCVLGVEQEDLTVQEASIDCLASLGGTFKQDEALEQILLRVTDSSWRIRVKVAKALGKFSQPKAQIALNQLKQDEDHRVVGATLETFLP